MGRLALSRGKGPSDLVPDAFTIAAQTGAALDSDVWSDDITPVGYDASTTCSGDGLGVKINGGSATPSGTISPGQSFKIGLHSSASNSTLVSATANVGGITAAFDVTTEAAAGAIPEAGPHALWDGTEGSGSAIPAQQAWITNKPVLVIQHGYTLDRVTGDYYICIGAFAPGGISVTMLGDCETVVNSTPCLNTVTLFNREDVTDWGHWFKIKGADFLAKSASGMANIYFIGTPTNPAWQPRVIGGNGRGTLDGTTAANWTEAEDMPMQILPRVDYFDGTKTIGSGYDYATLTAALADVGSLGLKAPLFRIMDNGTQTISHVNPGWDGSEGYVGIECGAGISATIQANSAFDPVNTGSTKWDVGFGSTQLMFGAGITLDVKNFKVMIGFNADKPFRFHCVIDNSAGDKAAVATYWNGSPYPGFSTKYAYSGSALRSYFDGCTFGAIRVGDFQHRVRHSTGVGMWGTLSGTRADYYNDFRNMGPDAVYPTWGAIISASYSGAAATAHVKAEAATAVVAYTNGVELYRVTIPSTSGGREYQAGQKTSELVAALNSHASNVGFTWTALQPDTGMWPTSLENAHDVYLNLKGTPVVGQPAGTAGVAKTLNAGIETHTEAWGPYGTENFQAADNYAMYACRMLDDFWTTSVFNVGGGGALFVGNTIVTKSQASGLTSGFNVLAAWQAHNVIEDGSANYVDRTGADNSIDNCVFTGAIEKVQSGDGAGSFPTRAIYRNCMHVQDANGAPTSPHSVTNLSTLANAKAQFVDWAGKNFSPAAASTLRTTLVVPVLPYDIDNNPRNMSGDAAGAIAN